MAVILQGNGLVRMFKRQYGKCRAELLLLDNVEIGVRIKC